MKSGKKKFSFEIKVDGKFNLKDYVNAHLDSECDGSWKVHLHHNTPYNVDALGVIQVPVIPFVICKKCNASYLIPGFEEFLDKVLSFKIVANRKILTANQIRFLRLAFDLTQQDIAEFLKMERTYYSKTESLKSGTALSPDKQVRLKIFYAQKLELTDPEIIYQMNIVDDELGNPRIVIDEQEFEEQLRKAIPIDSKMLA